MDTYRFCLLTVVSLIVTMIVVVKTAWLTRDRKLFGEELRQKNNITTLHSLISSNKTASQLHLEKHVTKKTTGKTFGFTSVTSCTKIKILLQYLVTVMTALKRYTFIKNIHV